MGNNMILSLFVAGGEVMGTAKKGLDNLFICDIL